MSEKIEGTFTKFVDMYSGGHAKLDWEYIWIEGTEEEAREIFTSRFHRNPDSATCDCCGKDYLVSEYPTLEVATDNANVLVILKGDPTP